MQRFLAATAAFLIAVGLSGPALAWGSDGHRYVGNLAWALLNPNARSHVVQLLGKDIDGANITLAAAAVWPDCIRNVKGSPGSLAYHPASGAVCAAFVRDPAEEQRMVDYAERHWTTCEYSHKPLECHRSFHFADVAIQHTKYKRGWYGAGPEDVVSAIQSATLVLEGLPDKPPFDIKDKREALLLLAHFVGDLHQPLHVGSIYLSPTGAPVNPDTLSGDRRKTETAGGNFLHFGSDNLHSDWDDIELGPTPDHAAVCAAAAVQPVAGALLDKPATWAGESVRAARNTAFKGITFTGSAGSWTAHFQNRANYISARKAVQGPQLVAAGARLAEVLNAVWPGPTPTLACP